MSRTTRKGFKLIELLIVIGIIAVMIGIMFPPVRRVRDAAARSQCANNLKQVMIGLHMYNDIHRSPAYPSSGNPDASGVTYFPPGCTGPGSIPEERLSWIVALLPYLDEEALYTRFDREKGYVDNLRASESRIQSLLCPASKEATTLGHFTNYVAMAGIGADAAIQPTGTPGNGFMGYDRLTSLSMIKDGTANTIAIMETSFNLGPWARGGTSTLRGFDASNVPPIGDQRPFGGHPTGFNVAKADGAVWYIRSSIDPKILAAASTIDGGEPVNLD
jgi:hypothetical protein